MRPFERETMCLVPGPRMHNTGRLFGFFAAFRSRQTESQAVRAAKTIFGASFLRRKRAEQMGDVTCDKGVSIEPMGQHCCIAACLQELMRVRARSSST